MNNLDTKINYPITKEQLKNGFNIINEINNNEKKQFLDKYVQDLLEIISVEIIRRTNIKNINNINIIDIQKFKFDFQEIGQRTGGFSSALNGKFVEYISSFWNNQKIRIQYNCHSYNILPEFQNNNYYLHNNFYHQISISESEIDTVKLKIFDGLKERFPDCLIQIDPMKTYILIDWN